MYQIKCDVAVVGGGPAGLAAAIAAKKEGAEKVLIIERDSSLGGILQQCIHPGFGLTYDGQELTGPEYAGRFIDEALELGVETLLDAMVLEVAPEGKVICATAANGITCVEAGAVVLSMGCRERTRGNIQIPGTRPAGVYTAGAAQRLINRQNTMVGKNVVILGSGDIGLIMARRMTLEGAKVKAVCELMPYSGGLARNIEQCLNDFGIPLMLSHTVVQIHGKDRVTGVTIAKVDEQRRPIKETEQYIACDTLLLSCGLLPENELTKGAGIDMDRITGGAVTDQSRQTSVPGVFACGNVLHVHDLVDYVSDEAEIAGFAAADYLAGKEAAHVNIDVRPVSGVRYTVPQRITSAQDTVVYFRVSDVFRDKRVVVKSGDRVISNKKKIKLAPGEMETVKLTADLLAEIGQGTITIGLED